MISLWVIDYIDSHLYDFKPYHCLIKPQTKINMDYESKCTKKRLRF